MDSLPKLAAELIDAVTRRACEAAKDVSGSDFGVPGNAPSVVDAVSSRVIASTKRALRSDLERIAMFTVLFRTQADQARRTDGVDATLGIFFTALLVAGPLAFDKAPTLTDRWIAAAGFCVVLLIVAVALFCVSGRELKQDIALQLANDVRTGFGNYEALREELNRLRENPFRAASPDRAARRGAAGAVAQLLARDRVALFAKRRLLTAAVIISVPLIITVGARDVLEYPLEKRYGHARTVGEAASHHVRYVASDSGGR